MALPTIRDVQAVDPILSRLVVGYSQADSRFLASRLFPAIPVDNKSGTYYIFTKKYWFLDEMQERAPGAEFARAGYGVESTTFTTLQYALEHVIPLEVQANSQVSVSLQEAGLRWLAQQSNIRKERQFASDFFAANVWGTTDNNSATDWDDFSLGDPVNDVLTARRTISNNTGQDANTLALGYIVHNAIVNHPDVIDRIKYTQAATQGNVEAALAALFGVQNYWVGKASFNSANEAQTFTGAAIIDDDALVCHCAPTPNPLTASCGYTFTWEPGGGLGSVAPYYDPRIKSDVLQHTEQWDQATVATDVGYIFLDIV